MALEAKYDDALREIKAVVVIYMLYKDFLRATSTIFILELPRPSYVLKKSVIEMSLPKPHPR